MNEKTLEELVEQRTERLRAEVERAREQGRRAGLEEAADRLMRRVVQVSTSMVLREMADEFRALACQPAPKVEACDGPECTHCGRLGRHLLCQRCGEPRCQDCPQEDVCVPQERVEAVSSTSPETNALLHAGVPMEVAEKPYLGGRAARGLLDAGVPLEAALPPGSMVLKRIEEAYPDGLPGMLAAGEVCLGPSPLEGAHKLGANSEDVTKAMETVCAALRVGKVRVRTGDDAMHIASGEAAFATLKRTLADLHARAERAEAEVERVKDARDEDRRHLTVRWEKAELARQAAEAERDAADRRTLEMCAVQEAEMQARFRAEADNAALVQALSPLVRDVLDLRAEGEGTSLFLARDGVEGPEVLSVGGLDRLLAAVDQPHPGAAMLERLRTLEQESVPTAMVREVLVAHEQHDETSKSDVLRDLRNAMNDTETT